MANGNRKPYETSTVLDQDFLDSSHDNLVNQLEMVVDIARAPTRTTVTFDNTTNTVTASNLETHLVTGEEIVFTTTGTLPTELALATTYYVLSVSGGVAFQVAATPGGAVIPFTDDGTGVHTAEHDFFIHASDRNKYVGGIFYEALLRFPVIKKTIGEFLSPELEFSSLSLELSNVDGRLNDILPGGDDFAGWIGRDVEVKLGLRDVESTYTTIFKGKITEEAGFSRSTSSVSITARSDFDRLNEVFPRTVFTTTGFSNIEARLENVVLPVIYGDWTVNVEPQVASIPAFPVNGADPDVESDAGARNNVQLVISENNNSFFDTSEVYLKRGDNYWRFDSADIVSVVDNRTFEIDQLSTLMTAITPDATDELYEYNQGDEIFVQVKGKDLGAYDDNLIEQARDIILTYTTLTSSDFDANWDTYRDKASPTESATGSMKSRVWIQEPEPTLTYVLSMLEQVRLEAFIDRNRKLKISSLHFDDWNAAPSYTLKNWDVERGSFQPTLDDRTNFNRAQGVYNFLPNRNENFAQTSIYRNQAAITQADGKAISKQIVFPNLYEEATVVDQTRELLKIASSYLEYINLNASWRSMLLDIGDFVKLNVDIQGTVFSEVICLVREIGYDPDGIKIPLRLWSLQMFDFPGYSPGYEGIVGGSSAVITEE